jgi:hypothetical protein
MAMASDRGKEHLLLALACRRTLVTKACGHLILRMYSAVPVFGRLFVCSFTLHCTIILLYPARDDEEVALPLHATTDELLTTLVSS